MSAPQTDAATHPTLDDLRAEAMAWGRRPRRRGSWYVTDLDSHNGTWLSDDGSRLPRQKVTTRTRLVDGMNLFVGSWTRLVLRRVEGPAEEPGASNNRGRRR